MPPLNPFSVQTTSLEWCWMFKFVLFLLILQNQASILHMLTSHLQRLSYSDHGNAHRELATGRSGCEWGTWCFRNAHGQLRGSVGEETLVPCMLPNAVLDIVSRIYVPLMPVKSSVCFSCCYPPCRYISWCILKRVRKKWASLTLP